MAVQLQAGSLGTYSGALGPTPLYQDLSVTASTGQGNRAVFLILSTAFSWTFEEVPLFDGSPMTLVSRETDASRKSVVYVTLNPSVGAHTVRVAATSWAGMQVLASAFVLDGVDQTTPYGTAVKDVFYSNDAPRSVSVTVASGGMAIAGHAIYGATDGSITLGSGQTALTGSYSDDTSEYRHSYKADATAMEFSWAGGANQGSQLVIPVNAAASGTTHTSTGALSAQSATVAGTAARSGGSVTHATSGALTAQSATLAGSASKVVAGTIVTDIMVNNTGTPLATTSVVWEWRIGTGIGVAPSSAEYGTGTTDADGILTLTGLAAGTGDFLAATTDYSAVYYQRTTVI